jgi:N-acetylglucosaminyldiphosphoundecaprenol N-acetyl-beta-D-mannosaminyltransferase
VVDELERRVELREPTVVCFANVHVIELARRDAELRRSLDEASLVLADGMPVAWACRLLGKKSAVRVAGHDFYDELCARTEGTGVRHFFLGSTEETLERLVAATRRRFPKLEIAGMLSPPFRPLTSQDHLSIAAAVDTAGAEVVWVGLGAPKQEILLSALRPLVTAPVLLGVGAVFDFASGTKRRAPRWMQRAGLEWLYRLASEPRRLWRRYLVTNVSFSARLVLVTARTRLWGHT